MSGSTNIPSCYLVLRKGNSALFVLRNNTGYMDGFYGLPAGHVEDMESFTSATIREAQEEVGVNVKIDNLNHLHTMHRNCGDHVRVDVFFGANNWEGRPKNNEPNKSSEIAWLDLNNLPENVMDYTVFALKQIKQGKTYSEFGWTD